MPLLGDGVRTAGYIGMYAQNLLLSLTARGYHGIPQAVLGVYADTVRRSLGVPKELKLLFGIALGLGDQTSPMHDIGMGRIPLHQSVGRARHPRRPRQPLGPRAQARQRFQVSYTRG
ncbi:nitroreductase family protein [Streptomyces sp. ME08-AFT2]|uniref:nitroreductase family protein n=1 Tax=Streptomyces sp. ME08-AFT2 TaxID=3028683 RepID=UPI0029B37CBC|nr:nitroreductase family protein [Streptomyces sp. ME08-AFT2]MDX3313532.1 nitroreductase family protein [Streptomyces sp. ME08-AFT2]